jgi:hypothetical protein
MKRFTRQLKLDVDTYARDEEHADICLRQIRDNLKMGRKASVPTFTTVAPFTIREPNERVRC